MRCQVRVSAALKSQASPLYAPRIYEISMAKTSTKYKQRGLCCAPPEQEAGIRHRALVNAKLCRDLCKALVRHTGCEASI